MIKLIFLNFKKSFLFLTLLIIFSALFEILSILLIIPFFNLILNTDTASLNPIFLKLPKKDFDSVGLLLIGTLLISCILRVFLLKITIKNAFSISAFLSIFIHKNINLQDYNFFLNTKNDYILNTMLNKLHSITYEIILPFLLSLSSIIILLFFIFSLFYANTAFAFISIFFIAFFYTFIILRTKKNSKKYSRTITKSSNNIQQILSDNLASIKSILIEGYQNSFISRFTSEITKLRVNQGLVVFQTFYPRILIESIALILVTSMLCYLKKVQVDYTVYIPILASLSLASIRLLPLVQQLYVSLNSIRTNIYHLKEIKNLIALNNNTEKKEVINFSKTVTLKNVNFFYNSRKIIFSKLNLEFFKGDKILILGKSGLGKSTLIHLISGLVTQKSGEILIDKTPMNTIKNWSDNVAYVDQSCFLFNGSVMQNLFFPDNYPPKKSLKLFNALKKELFVKDILNSNFLTRKVGDQGSLSLSGGQIQRISIIRSLLKDKPIIIYDEVTSSLDKKTGSNMLNLIQKYSKEKLLIFIRHNKENYNFCNKIIKFEEKKISMVTK